MSAAMRDLVLRIVAAHGRLEEFNHSNEFYLNIENPPYMRLVIERLYADDHGCVVVSVAHYGEQNGDAMRDPEMCFDASNWLELYFRNDYLPLEQYVFTTPERKKYRPHLAKSLRSFARTWATNLHEQGFDKVPA